MFNVKKLFKQARSLSKTIVYPEAAFSARTLEAVKIVAKKKIAKPLLIGDESAIILADKALAKFHIINPKTFDKTEKFAKALYAARKDKGLTLDQAKELILDPYYFATILVSEGYADGMVGGAESSTARTIKPALQIIKAEKRNGLVSSSFLVYGKNKFLKDKTLLLSDCGLVPNPTAEQLVQIANETLSTYNCLGLNEYQQPKLAFLSYSSHGSADGEAPQKVKQAHEKFKKEQQKLARQEHHPDKVEVVKSDGEIQFDAALVPNVASIKCPESEIQGDANILIFPSLDSGNICYKAVQYVGELKAVGPILQGLKKPVNDLSRGCSVEDIVVVSAITAIQSKKD